MRGADVPAGPNLGQVFAFLVQVLRGLRTPTMVERKS
jgi:hypothetical protein